MRKVQITFAVDDLQRWAIAHHYGQVGAANREEVTSFLYTAAWATLEDIVSDYTVELEVDE